MLKEGKQPIKLLKPIENMLVEEYETNILRLSEYVSGGLVNYQVDIDYVNDTDTEEDREKVLQVAREVIKVNKGCNSLHHMYLPNADLAEVIEPFPRSTVMVDNNYGNLMMYYLDRNFNFGSFCL